MKKIVCILLMSLMILSSASAVEMDDLMRLVEREVSGNRARDYTMRLWQYDKWNTFPMWEKTAREAQSIMRERSFDEAEIVDTPTDGVTKYGTWTNPIAWDCYHATLEVIEPEGLPDEYRFLCDYRDNPSCVNFFSCPTPPGGMDYEVVVLDRANEKSIDAADAKDKIVMVNSNAGGMKKYLAQNGASGILTDQIEGANRDFINENQWLNTWSDFPGGWMMTANDSREHFAFSISPKKGEYLRQLVREGKTVKLRAIIDSRYYTDGSLPYVTGGIIGTEGPEKDVLIVGHMYEWGANDNCSGSAAIIESIAVLNDLIKRGDLPRPKRSIRAWLGFELYGSTAYTVQNIERLRTGTLCAVCCDTPAIDYDASTSTWNVTNNFNACPSFTDAVFPEMAGRYYSRYSPNKNWKVIPFKSGRDNFFGDPFIGVPLNAVSMNNGSHLHHNSMDTIDKTDPRSLRDLSILNAVYLYTMANADRDDVPLFANLAFERAIALLTSTAKEMKAKAFEATGSEELGKALADGDRIIAYYADHQADAIKSIARVGDDASKANIEKELAPWLKELAIYAKQMRSHFKAEVKRHAKSNEMKIVKYKKEAANPEETSIVPKRLIPGMLTMEGIPPEKWSGTWSSPRWWSQRNFSATSYFWVDGKRNLSEIRELMEIEAERPIGDYDLVGYFKLLEEYNIIEFVE